MSELLEKILANDNMNAAYKRVCANKGAGVEVENDFDGDITIDKETGLPMTSKKDKYLHGIGLYNLQKCARKYMGDVDIEIQSKDGRKRFLLTVMMNGKISLQK